MKWFCGIDPGVSGAIAFFNGNQVIVSNFPTETVVYASGKKRKRIVSEHAAELFQSFDIQFAVLEEVSSMPKQGVASTFAFGEAYGIIQGILGARKIQVMKVKPSVWKINMGLSSDKKLSMKKAKELFDADFENDGQAEAALLAKVAFDMYNKSSS